MPFRLVSVGIQFFTLNWFRIRSQIVIYVPIIFIKSAYSLDYLGRVRQNSGHSPWWVQLRNVWCPLSWKDIPNGVNGLSVYYCDGTNWRLGIHRDINGVLPFFGWWVTTICSQDCLCLFKARNMLDIINHSGVGFVWSSHLAITIRHLSGYVFRSICLSVYDWVGRFVVTNAYTVIRYEL